MVAISTPCIFMWCPNCPWKMDCWQPSFQSTKKPMKTNHYFIIQVPFKISSCISTKWFGGFCCEAPPAIALGVQRWHLASRKGVHDRSGSLSPCPTQNCPAGQPLHVCVQEACQRGASVSVTPSGFLKPKVLPFCM